jgi:hypothetical protein
MSIVYILTNEAMPGLIKIGLTNASVEQRMLSLDTTSVPLPFECYYAAQVSDSAKVERALHVGLGDHRVRNSREFFRMEPYRAKAILELLAIADVTPGNSVFAEAEDQEALARAVALRPAFRFSMVNISPGSVLNFTKDESITATVIDDKRIRFRDKETSLSSAALEIVHDMGYTWKQIAGPQWWLYEGTTLSELRNLVEQDEANDEFNQ